jgi:hypothetical protein
MYKSFWLIIPCNQLESLFLNSFDYSSNVHKYIDLFYGCGSGVLKAWFPHVLRSPKRGKWHLGCGSGFQKNVIHVSDTLSPSKINGLFILYLFCPILLQEKIRTSSSVLPSTATLSLSIRIGFGGGTNKTSLLLLMKICWVLTNGRIYVLG